MQTTPTLPFHPLAKVRKTRDRSEASPSTIQACAALRLRRSARVEPPASSRARHHLLTVRGFLEKTSEIRLGLVYRHYAGLHD